MTKAIKSTNLW